MNLKDGELGGYIAEGTQFGLGTLLLRYSRDYEKHAVSRTEFREYAALR